MCEIEVACGEHADRLTHAHAHRGRTLAILLQRRPETVRQDYLRPLLKQRRIAMTLPDQPNDPEQAYRAVESPQ